jgi:hypothetical protein
MEGRMAEVQRRYATALELVGEKTEQVRAPAPRAQLTTAVR